MPTEQNKAIRRRFDEEVFNSKNLAAIDEFFAEGFVDHATLPGMASGVEGVKQRHAMLFQAFPDCHITLDDMVAEEDRVATRFTIRGTHTGEFMGLPPTGKPVAMTGIDVMRVVNGKFTEHWVEVDRLGMLQQLGVIPTPGQ